MVYDPNQKTLLVDKGEIRIGPDYQADVPGYVPPTNRKKDSDHTGEKLWEPNKMSDQKVEQFLVVSRSIGTFARALLDGAKKPQISLRLGAAAASRDITLVCPLDLFTSLPPSPSPLSPLLPSLTSIFTLSSTPFSYLYLHSLLYSLLSPLSPLCVIPLPCCSFMLWTHCIKVHMISVQLLVN